MTEKVGRNDPCPCGSGKKYKACCLLKEQPRGTVFGGRKFKAKVLSAGGMKPDPEQSQKANVDYTTLMERSFGQALKPDDKPPTLSDPSEFLEN